MPFRGYNLRTVGAKVSNQCWQSASSGHHIHLNVRISCEKSFLSHRSRRGSYTTRRKAQLSAVTANQTEQSIIHEIVIINQFRSCVGRMWNMVLRPIPAAACRIVFLTCQVWLLSRGAPCGGKARNLWLHVANAWITSYGCQYNAAFWWSSNDNPKPKSKMPELWSSPELILNPKDTSSSFPE